MTKLIRKIGVYGNIGKSKHMRKISYIIIAAVLGVIIVVGTFTGIYLSNHSASPATSSAGFAGTAGVTGSASSTGVIKVVAAENFWGGLETQLGGKYVKRDKHRYRPQCRSTRIRKQRG